MSIKKISFFAFLVVAGGLWIQGISYSMQPPPLASTGAPGEGTCSGCHMGGASAGTAELTCTPLENQDSIYTVKLKTTGTGINTWGFQLTALDANGNSVGTFTRMDGNRTVAIRDTDFRRRLYVSHTRSGISGSGGNEWTLEWKKPATFSGNVTFYYAIVAANGNNTSTGDRGSTGSKVVSVGLTNRVPQVSSLEQSYPNPSDGRFVVRNLTPGASLQLLDLNGKELYSAQAKDVVHLVELQQPPAGIYTLRVTQTDGQLRVERIVIR